MNEEMTEEMQEKHAEMQEEHAEMQEKHAEMQERHAEMQESHGEITDEAGKASMPETMVDTGKQEESANEEDEAAKAFKAARIRAVKEYMREYEAAEKQKQEALKRQREQEQAEAEKHKTRFTGQPFALNCGDWQADDGGVYKMTANAKGEESRIVACYHPVMPVERLLNLDNGKEKLCLAFYRDGKWRHITVDCTVCFNRQQIIALSDRGILVTSETARYLVQYLTEVVALNMNPAEHDAVIPVSRSISRMGWCGDEFVPYVADIRYDGDADFAGIYDAVHTAGSREEWYRMARELRKNKVVRLLMDASLASPLIERVGALPFILHLWGSTGFGKTVALMLAMSVWGNPDTGYLTRTMNMTPNAMARTAAFLKHLPFGADELQQMKNSWRAATGQNFDQLIMYLTEGIDRGRAKAHGGIERLDTWRNCFIFTGEEPITKANSGGGARNRVIEVEAAEPIFASGNVVANTVREHFGWAGKEFIHELNYYNNAELKGRYAPKVRELETICHTTSKQAHSMALILLADEIACSSIFDGEEPLHASDVAEYLYSEKAVDVAERAYEWCMDWLDRNQNRFVASGNYGEIWGRIGDGFAMINKSVLEEELRKAGYEYDSLSRRWAERGYIMRAKDGRFRHKTTVNGLKSSYIKMNLNVDRNPLGVFVNDSPPIKFSDKAEQIQIPA